MTGAPPQLSIDDLCVKGRAGDLTGQDIIEYPYPGLGSGNIYPGQPSVGDRANALKYLAADLAADDIANQTDPLSVSDGQNLIDTVNAMVGLDLVSSLDADKVAVSITLGNLSHEIADLIAMHLNHMADQIDPDHSQFAARRRALPAGSGLDWTVQFAGDVCSPGAYPA